MDKNLLKKAVAELKMGKTSSFETVYMITQNNFMIYARACTKTEQDAEDVLQEAYIQIIKSIKNLNSIDAFITWSKRIILNVSLHKYSQKEKEPMLTSEDSEFIFNEIEERETQSLPLESYLRKETSDIVMSVLNKLPASQKIAIIAFYYDQMSIKEIAYMMDCMESTIKTRLFYARKAMKENISLYETKCNIKLHSLIPAPIIAMGFRDNLLSLGMSKETSKAILGKVCKSTNILLANVENGITSTVETNTNIVKAGIKTSTSTCKASKLAAIKGLLAGSLVRKVVTGMAIVSLVACGGVGTKTIIKNSENVHYSEAFSQAIADSLKEHNFSNVSSLVIDNDKDNKVDFLIIDWGEDSTCEIYYSIEKRVKKIKHIYQKDYGDASNLMIFIAKDRSDVAFASLKEDKNLIYTDEFKKENNCYKQYCNSNYDDNQLMNSFSREEYVEYGKKLVRLSDSKELWSYLGNYKIGNSRPIDKAGVNAMYCTTSERWKTNGTYCDLVNIPQLVPFCKNAPACNEVISNEINGYFDKVEEEREGYNSSWGNNESISYEIYRNGVTSMMRVRANAYSDGVNFAYYYDNKNGNLITSKEYARLNGYTENEVLQQAVEYGCDPFPDEKPYANEEFQDLIFRINDINGKKTIDFFFFNGFYCRPYNCDNV